MELQAVPLWMDRKAGVVVVHDDVQNVIRDLKAIDQRLVVYWNEQGQEFDIVERRLDGIESLVFSVPELDQRVVERVRAADHWHGETTPRHVLGDDEDFVARVDAHNEAMEKLRTEQTADQVGDAGERLAWALDITKDHHSVGGSISVPKEI